MSESPSLANLQNKQNRDQQYLAVRCNPGTSAPRGSNSNDSGSFGKAEGNEYIEDICPYATFQLNKQTYSESSYSGNVYSGPYHSVRGSFVYHDVKPESYHVSTVKIAKSSIIQEMFLIINIIYLVQGTGVHQSAAKSGSPQGSSFREPR